jgi:glycosyltransferase involved in cell wall biosynthesis
MVVGFYHESAGERESGGIAVFVRELAIELSAERDVVLYTAACTPAPALRDSAVEVVQIPPADPAGTGGSLLPRVTPLNEQNVAKLSLFASAARNGYLEHIEANVDVLLTSQWLDDLLLSNAVDTPTVYEYHGVANVGLGSRLRTWFSGAEYTLANSRDTATRVHNRFGTPVDGVVYPGVDVERYHPDVDPAFECDEPVVLFVGRVTEQKGVFDLLDAFAPLAEDARLRVVGRGDTAELEARARELGVADAVTVEGVVPEAALPGYYAACDVYCLPSHYESFGIGNLEAMATGTPVVTTKTGGVPEYATHEENALLAPAGATDRLGGHLEGLLESPALREELGAAGRAVAESFSWSAQAAELGAFCESVESDSTREVDRRAPELST